MSKVQSKPPDPDPTVPWWTAKETAAWLGVARWLLRAWHRQGIGPPTVQVGQRCAYRPADVQAWLGHQRPGRIGHLGP